MNPLLKALIARHGIVQSKLDAEMKARRPDEVRLSALKKLKLRLKDQIVRLERIERDGLSHLRRGRRGTVIPPVSL